MSKAPAFPFYPKDHLSDARVSAMTVEQEGAYLRLLMYQWIEGSIPNDPDVLSALTRIERGRIDTVWAAIRDRFVPLPGGTDRLVNTRLERERQLQDECHLRRSESGRKAAVARWSRPAETQCDSNTTAPLFDASSASVSIAAASKKPAKARKLVVRERPSRKRVADPRAVEVFEYWKQVMDRSAPLDAATERLICARLYGDQYSVEELKAAIDGCKSSRWHMGDNPDKKPKNDISSICRDGANVRRLASFAPRNEKKPVQQSEPLPYFLSPEFIKAEEEAVAERLAKKTNGGEQ